MLIQIACVLLCFPPMSFSSLSPYPQLSRPPIARPQNLSRRLQPVTADDADATNNELYDRGAWDHPKPDVPLLRPEVKRYYDHPGGDDFQQHVDSYSNVEDYHDDSGYHRLPPPKPFYVAVKTKDEHDILSKLGLLAIVKLLFTKFKTFWLIKFGLFLLLIIKIPIVILKIVLKVLIFLKFTKLLKLIIIPSLIPIILLPLLPLVLLLLLPLLVIPLAPLLFIPVLLPLLIPLLLLLPVPVFAHHRPHPIFEHRPPSERPTATEGPDTDEEKSQRSWKGLSSVRSLEEVILLTRRVMESQQCMEKLACDIGGSHTPTALAGTVARLLEMFQSLAPKTISERLHSYTRAFKLGAEQRRKCSSEFSCLPPPGMFHDVIRREEQTT